MSYLRGYTFACICGRQAKGTYPITKAQSDGVREHGLPLDPKKAICRMAKDAPNPAPWSRLTRKSPEQPHFVGCGRTLEESDAERRALAEATS